MDSNYNQNQDNLPPHNREKLVKITIYSRF